MSIFPKSPLSTITSAEYENIFQKYAKEKGINKFAELKEKIASMSNNNETVMKYYSNWERKLKLDRNAAKEIFS